MKSSGVLFMYRNIYCLNTEGKNYFQLILVLVAACTKMHYEAKLF
jgi:hypothetical protein